ncbi:MAG TPA: terminase small subunit [Verrucomicrobiae bacterium]|nr:terminase small subunit [Verrucomicrobiae bacterium]
MDNHDPAATPAAKPPKRRAQLFVSEYLKDLNGAQAAIRAGYSPATAMVTASKLLANVSISTAVREAQDQIIKENHVTVSRIVRELALIAFFDPACLYDDSGRLLAVSEMPLEVRHALSAVEIVESANGARRLRFAGKLAALIALARHMSMFTDRIGDDPTDLPSFEEFLKTYKDEDEDEAPKAA